MTDRRKSADTVILQRVEKYDSWKLVYKTVVDSWNKLIELDYLPTHPTYPHVSKQVQI